MPRTRKQLLKRVKDAFVKMKKAVLNVVPYKMNIKPMRVCRLSTVVAEFPRKCIAAVFTVHLIAFRIHSKLWK